jgi:hypothetical protein
MPQRGAAVPGGNRSRYEDRTSVARVGPSPFGRSEPSEREPSQREPREREPPEREPPERVSTEGVPGRRTVTIRGQGDERYVPTRSSSSRRRPERRHERPGFRPDRTAMWAVLLGLMLILAAAASAHADTLHALSQLHR